MGSPLGARRFVHGPRSACFRGGFSTSTPGSLWGGGGNLGTLVPFGPGLAIMQALDIERGSTVSSNMIMHTVRIARFRK